MSTNFSKQIRSLWSRTAVFLSMLFAAGFLVMIGQTESVGSAFEFFATLPFAQQLLHPEETAPAEARMTEIRLVGTPGEYLTASVGVQALDDLTDVLVAVSDLNGTTVAIPPNAWDLRTVKWWHQQPYGNNLWDTIRYTPELLLHDDSLVNAVRPQPAENLNGVPPSDNTIVFNEYKAPPHELVDPSMLQSLSIPQGILRQFWLTLHIPPETPAGTYNGSVNLQTSGGNASMPVTVEVLPFTLSRSMFTHSIYYRSGRGCGELSVDKCEALLLNKSDDQMRLEISDLLAHGINNIFWYADPDRVLMFRREFGLTGPYYHESGESFSFDDNQVNTIEEFVERMHSEGVDEVYIYVYDEPSPSEVNEVARRAQNADQGGAQTFAAITAITHPDMLRVVAPKLDLLVAAGDNASASHLKQWRDTAPPGTKIFSYGGPFAYYDGAKAHRYMYGLMLWKVGLDGVANYAYQAEGGDDPWEELQDGNELHYVYPLSQGFVPTMQWEGFRQAVNDARYLSTLLDLLNQAGQLYPSDAFVLAANDWISQLKERLPDLPQQFHDWTLQAWPCCYPEEEKSWRCVEGHLGSRTFLPWLDGDSSSRLPFSEPTLDMDIDAIRREMIDLIVGLDKLIKEGVATIPTLLDPDKLVPNAAARSTPPEKTLGEVADESLVGHWTFDDGEGQIAKDASGHGNDGTLVGPSWSSGLIAGALRFDGLNAYVKLGSKLVNTTGDFTVSAWVNADDSKVYYGIVSELGDEMNAGEFTLRMTEVPPKVEFFRRRGGSTEIDLASPQSSLSPGKWTHVVAVYQTGELKIYINGTQNPASSILSSYGAIGVPAETNIGISDACGNNPFKGLIDDVRIYKRALGSDEVRNLYAVAPAPETAIISGPNNLTKDTQATFAFASNKSDSAFERRLDSGEWVVTTSPDTLTGLGEGMHLYEVRATDPLGNVDLTPATHSWTVDNTPPETTITVNPPDPTNSTSATFEFVSNEVASRFERRLDGGNWMAATSPEILTFLLEGRHTYEVQAMDALGNADPTPAIHEWTVDITPPTVAITVPSTDPARVLPTGFIVEGTATDTTSGVSTVRVLVYDYARRQTTSFGNVPYDQETGHWSFAVSASSITPGSWARVSSRSTDAAGNLSSRHSIRVYVDNGAAAPPPPLP